MAKISFLKDTFDVASLDTSKWSVSGPGLAMFGGMAVITPSTIFTTLTTVRQYDQRRSVVSVELVSLGAGSTRQFFMASTVDSNNSVSMHLNNATLTFRLRTAGVNSDTTLAFSSAMTWWRILERNGTLYWYTSTDGMSWTLQRSATHTLDLSAVTFSMSCGLSSAGGGSAPDVASILGVNSPAVVASTAPAAVRAPKPAVWTWGLGDWHDTGPSLELTMPEGRSLSISLKEPSSADFSTWGYSAEAEGLSELVTDLWVTRNGQHMFRGRCMPTTDTITAATYTLSAKFSDYRELINRRIIWTDVIATAEEQASTVWGLVHQAQAMPGGDMGINLDPVYAGTGITRTAEFKAGESPWEAIAKYSNMEGGFDIEIDKDKVFYMHFPGMGSDTGETLDFGGTVVAATRTFDPSNFANAIRQSGADVTTASTQVVADIGTAPEGRWDAQFGDLTLLTNDMVTDTALAALERVSRIHPTYRLTMGKGTWRGPGHIWIGDYVLVVVKAGRLNDVYTARVYNMDISLDENDQETVNVTVGDPRMDIRSVLKGISRRLRSVQNR